MKTDALFLVIAALLRLVVPGLLGGIGLIAWGIAGPHPWLVALGVLLVAIAGLGLLRVWHERR